MNTKSLINYCLSDEFLQANKLFEDPKCRMSDAEVMTTALVAALYWEVTLDIDSPGRIDRHDAGWY